MTYADMANLPQRTPVKMRDGSIAEIVARDAGRGEVGLQRRGRVRLFWVPPESFEERGGIVTEV